jgi:hypothetical protein
VATHAFGEDFVMLPGTSALARISSRAELYDVARSIRVATLGIPAEAAREQTFINTGISRTPWAPNFLTGTRHVPSTNDWRITWKRRCRYPEAGGLQDEDEPPLELDCTPEAYEVDIVDGGGVVKRTISVSTEQADYTAAQQTTDFGGVQSSINVRIYQISQVVGRGKVAAKTFP